MGFDFDIVNKHRDIDNELKNSGLSYVQLKWKNILNTYDLYEVDYIHKGLYKFAALPYYLYYDKDIDLICFTKIQDELVTFKDDLYNENSNQLNYVIKSLIDLEILCNEIAIRYDYYMYRVSKHFPTYDIRMEDIAFLKKLSSYNFDWKLSFKHTSPWDEEIKVSNVTIDTNLYRNDISENDVNDLVQVYTQCKKYNKNITFLLHSKALYGTTEIFNNSIEAIKNPYFHLMSVIETSVKGYKLNIEKLLPYISYTEKLICKNILHGNNYISDLERYVLNTCTYEYAITITAMYIFQVCNYNILKFLYTNNNIVLSLAKKYNKSNSEISEDIITYHDCLCYYYAHKCNQQNNLPIKYKK